MAYTVRGTFNVEGTMKVQGKIVGNTLTTSDDPTVYAADANGHVEVPVPYTEDVDYIFGQLPLTQYGLVNDYPIGVNGSFDGGSTVPYYSVMPTLLEEDGTLAYLRPGTNGNTINYYYTYIPNPTLSMQNYNTIVPYYHGSSYNIMFSDSDTKNVLMYEDLVQHKIHLVLTYGTLQNQNHKEAIIDRSLLPWYNLYAIKVENYIYIISLYCSSFNTNSPITDQYVADDPFQFVINRVPISQIEAGNITTVERVNFSGTTMYGDATTNIDSIKVADALVSSTDQTTVKSFIKYTATGDFRCNPWTYSIYGSVKAFYENGVLTFAFYAGQYSINNIARVNSMYTFTVTVNTNTRTYTSTLTPTPISLTSTPTTTIVVDNPYSITAVQLNGGGGAVGDGEMCSWYITDTGIQYFIKEKYILNDYYVLKRSQIENYTTKAAAYDIKNRTLTQLESRQVVDDFASRVGDQLMGWTPITATRILFSGTGTYKGTHYAINKVGAAEIGTTRNYVYQSVDRGTTITGYAPQIFREPLTATTQSQLVGKISLCNQSNQVNAYGCAFIEDAQLVSGFKLNPDTLLFDKTISISNTTLVNLKSSILSSLGLTPENSKIGLYYVPNSFGKSYACVMTTNGTTGGNWILADVTCTFANDVVTGASNATVLYNSFDPQLRSIFTRNDIKSGLAIVKYSDFTYVSVSFLLNAAIPGDSRGRTIAIALDSNNTKLDLIAYSSYHISGKFPGNREFSYIPNYGFGFYRYDNTDKATKAIFNYCGNTLADFSKLNTNLGTDMVVLAQDVANGFIVYFTEVTPLLMAGKYYELPITQIDLSTIKADPSNTTFYAYVRLQNNNPIYTISTVELPESVTCAFIGTITTDDTHVNILNIEKVSRFDNYRPSVSQRGSAFPVSTGNPLDTGTINW